VTLDGSGSSDADGMVTQWYWDLDPTVDNPAGDQMIPGGDDWDADEKDELHDDRDVDGVTVVVKLPIGKHVVTLTVWDNHHKEPPTFRDYYNTTNETHTKHRKTDQDQCTVIVIGKIKEIAPPEYITADEISYVTSATEFSLNDHIPDEFPYPMNNYYRIWYDDIWTDWIEYTDPFTLEGECIHTIEYYGEITVEDEIIRSPVFTNVHRVDDTPPVTTPDYTGPAYTGHSDGHYITPDTEIRLKARDGGTEPCIVGVDHTTYRVWLQDHWSDWFEYVPDDDGFLLMTEGKYHIEYYSTDLLGNTEELRNTTVFVDNTPPTTSKVIKGPQHYDGAWVTSETAIVLNAEDRDAADERDGVGVERIQYRIWYTGNWSDWTDLADGEELQLEGEGVHYLEYYAADLLTFIEDVHNQTHIVDDTGPDTHKTIGDPNHEEGLWVTSHTPLLLAGFDGTGVGVNVTHYREWYNGEWSDWMEIDGELVLEGEGDHMLEFYSTDHLGNVGDTMTQDHTVDDSPPSSYEEVGDPSTEKGYYVTNETPIWLNATDIDNEGDNASGVMYIQYEVWWDSDENGVIDDNDTMVDSDRVEGETVTLYLENEGLNEIRWYSVDNLDNMEDTQASEHVVVEGEQTFK